MNANGPFPQFTPDEMCSIALARVILDDMASRDDVQHVASEACRRAAEHVGAAVRAIKEQRPLDERATE